MLEFVYLTATTLMSSNGNWRIHKTVDHRTQKPKWVLSRKITQDQFRIISREDSIDDARKIATDYETG